MKFWIWAIVALLVQESVTTSAVMTIAYQNHHNLYVFFLLFFSITISEIIFCHFVGIYIKKRNIFLNITDKLQRHISKANNLINIRDKKIFIVILSSSFLPASLTTIIATWLNLSFKTVFLYAFLGNLIWFISLWLLVVGINTMVGNPNHVVLEISLVIVIIIILEKVIYKYLRGKVN